MVRRLASGVPMAMSNSASILLQLISAYCFELILIGNLSPVDTPRTIGQRDSDLSGSVRTALWAESLPAGRQRPLPVEGQRTWPAVFVVHGISCSRPLYRPVGLAQPPAPVDLPRPGRTMQLRVRPTAWLRDLAYRPEFST